MMRWGQRLVWGCLLLGLVGAAQAADPLPPTLSLAPADSPALPGREALKARGIEFGLTYIGDVLGNVKGGLRQGGIYQGRADLQVDVDLAKLADREGLSFHTNVYQIHGTGLSRYYVGNLNVVSNIEALPATRLHELWLEQAFFGKALTIRAGKLAADAEFFVSPSASVFVNAALGWPTIAAVDLPSGGAAYPLATPGIRAKFNLSDTSSVMVALFNGDPAGTGRGAEQIDPQTRNRNGTDFSVGGPPFLITEASHSYVAGGSGPERTGVIKAGFFHHFGRFDDPRTDTLGLPLASPASSGIARRWRGEDGLYALIDQTIYREDAESGRGAAAFMRVSASPNPASVIDFDLDGGIVYKGLLRERPDDVIGLSFSYSTISAQYRGADRDRIFYEGIAMPVRRAEAIAELTYQAVLAPGVTIQPDIQYVRSPGGGIRNPRLPTSSRIKDSLVIGLRATIQY